MTNNTPNWNQLRQEIEAHGNASRIDMGTLRDLVGGKRIGVHVLQSIQDRLTEHGLATLPRELPVSKYEEVVVYLERSSIGKAIDAVLNKDITTLREVVEPPAVNGKRVQPQVAQAIIDIQEIVSKVRL